MPAQLFLSESHGLFGPDEILVMTDALEDAWQALQAEGVDPLLGDGVRHLLAKFILKIASAGEWDPVRLHDACMAYVSQQQPYWGALL